MSTRGRICLLGLLAVTFLALGGCGKNIEVTQYPAFYTEDLKVIAVTPFRSGQDPRAGGMIADNVANALGANGTYKIYNRSDLKAILDEQDLQVAMGGDTQAAAAQLRKSGKVQALMTGAVTTYSASTRSTVRQDPIYAYRRDGSSYITGYTPVTVVHNEATVAVTAAFVRVSDGSTLYSTPAPATATIVSEGDVQAPRDPEACRAAATAKVVRQLVDVFAVVRKQVKVNPDQDFRLARDFYDNQWSVTNEFKASDPKMLVVVSLPPAADRNRFKVTIVRKDCREDLASTEFVWSNTELTGTGKNAARSIEFSPHDIAAKGGGPGDYTAKLYSGPEPVMMRDFRIR